MTKKQTNYGQRLFDRMRTYALQYFLRLGFRFNRKFTGTQYCKKETDMDFNVSYLDRTTSSTVPVKFIKSNLHTRSGVVSHVVL